MNNVIKYIGFYDRPDSLPKRARDLSAINKMDYICDALRRAGYYVHLISPSWFNEPDARWTQQTTVNLNEHNKLTLCPSVGTRNKFTLYLKIVFSLIWLFSYLIVHVRKGETILVYNATWLSLPVRMAKFIKGFRLILEVEEINGDVWDMKGVLRQQERKLIAKADSYIAVSDVLAEILGDKTKLIIYGSYAVSESHVEIANHSMINIVYAGSIDHTKGGAYNAIKCIFYLPENYVLHICGNGVEKEIKDLEQQISEMNAKLRRSACIYHGLIPDKDFSDFLHTCDIAINPQYAGDNMTTLFPSKIIKYLSHNLRVVSTRIISIEKSKVSPLITFSGNDSPEAIAHAIRSINLNAEFDSRAVIKKLDEEFVRGIREIVGDHA